MPRAFPQGSTRVVAVWFFGMGLAVLTALPAPARPGGVSGYLDSVRDEPVRLAAFLRDMPKGGDLHMHLSGAVSTETLVRFSVEKGLCLDKSLVSSPPPCRAGQRPAADVDRDRAFYDQVIAAWSMKGFAPGAESGHDHFFATFGKFSAAGDGQAAEMLAEVAAQAASENEHYLEPLLTPQYEAVSALAQRVGYDPDFEAMRRKLFEDGSMDRIVSAARGDTDELFDRFRSILACGTSEADPGCDVPIRFDYQVLRAMAPEVVFAQLVLGFELMERDPRFVGVNMVQPEDDPVARRDYGLHMRMVGYLRGQYRRDNVTLHAGELTSDLAPPADLRSHIAEAVAVAGAQRIGHGVDIAGEDNATGVLRTMAERHVLVEIALTSNRQILGVSGDRHPFNLYRRAGVPVALATDDEGVSRIDLTVEYQYAVTTYQLPYEALKTMARASLDHGFLQGKSLWRGPDDFSAAPACAGEDLGGRHPARACRALLRSSPKAAAEWHQEGAFDRFERRYGG